MSATLTESPSYEVTIDHRVKEYPQIATAVEEINHYYREKYLVSHDRLAVDWGIDAQRGELELQLTRWSKHEPSRSVQVRQAIPMDDLTKPTLRDVWAIHVWGDLLEKGLLRSNERLLKILSQPDESE